MAQLTFTELVGEVGAYADLDVATGSDSRTSVERAINRAARRIWVARPWYERRAEVIQFLVAPYSTGTVDLTNASTAVTGSGTTWTTAFSGRKIALGAGSPWYRFTRTADTTGTIPTGGYNEATATGSTYTIFQDEVDVSSTCDIITSVSLIYQNGRVDGVSEGLLDANAYVHGGVGVPRLFGNTDSTTAGTRRIRLWPVPDAAYRLRIHYLKSYTDMSNTTDLCGLGVNKEPLLFKASCLEVQSLSDARKMTSEAEVQALIEDAWASEQSPAPMSYKRQGFDHGTLTDGYWLGAPVL
jgi:hypothetical protein